MPKTTQKKEQKLVKPGKGSDDCEMAAYDITYSLNKINSLGKLSRTGKKTNAESYDNIKSKAAYVFSLLKEPVKEDDMDIRVHLNLINSIFYEIWDCCQEYIDKNRGFRWSSKGRARVREVKRLQNAITMLTLHANSWKASELLEAREVLGFDTYAKAYGFGSYISSVSTESDSNAGPISNGSTSTLADTIRKASGTDQKASGTDQKASDKKTEEIDVNEFNDHLLSYDELNVYGMKHSCLIVFRPDFEAEKMKLRVEKNEEDKKINSDALNEMYSLAKFYNGDRGAKIVEMIWNSYRHEFGRKTGQLAPGKLSEYIEGYKEN